MGTVRADNFSDGAGTGAPDFATGIKVSGGFDSSGGAGVGTAALQGTHYLPQGEVYLQDGNGHGSTNNKIRRFTTTQINTGTSITYADSATLGATFTINQTGIYHISYGDIHTADVNNALGISVNSNQLTTSISAITLAHVAMLMYTAGNGIMITGSTTLNLTSTDIVRAHTDGSINGVDRRTWVRITQLFRTA